MLIFFSIYGTYMYINTDKINIVHRNIYYNFIIIKKKVKYIYSNKFQ